MNVGLIAYCKNRGMRELYFDGLRSLRKLMQALVGLREKRNLSACGQMFIAFQCRLLMHIYQEKISGSSIDIKMFRFLQRHISGKRRCRSTRIQEMYFASKVAIARFEGRQPKNQKKSKGQKVNRSEAQKAWSGDQMVRESGQKVTGSDE